MKKLIVSILLLAGIISAVTPISKSAIDENPRPQVAKYL